MALEQSMRAVVEPEVDQRKAQREIDDLEEQMSRVEQLEPSVESGALGSGAPNADAGAGGAGGGGGGGAGAAAAASAGRGGMVGGGLMRVALAGAVGVGLLKGIGRLAQASPALQKQSKMFGKAMDLFFQPFGREFSQLLSPISENVLDMAKNFNDLYSSEGLGVALSETSKAALEGLGEFSLGAVGLDELVGESELGEMLVGGTTLLGLLGGTTKLMSLLSLPGSGALASALGISGGSLAISTLAVGGALTVGTIAAAEMIAQSTSKNDTGLLDIIQGTQDEDKREEVGESFAEGSAGSATLGVAEWIGEAATSKTIAGEEAVKTEAQIIQMLTPKDRRPGDEEAMEIARSEGADPNAVRERADVPSAPTDEFGLERQGGQQQEVQTDVDSGAIVREIRTLRDAMTGITISMNGRKMANSNQENNERYGSTFESGV